MRAASNKRATNVASTKVHHYRKRSWSSLSKKTQTYGIL